jgi:hypothetical protein
MPASYSGPGGSVGRTEDHDPNFTPRNQAICGDPELAHLEVRPVHTVRAIKDPETWGCPSLFRLGAVRRLSGRRE